MVSALNIFYEIEREEQIQEDIRKLEEEREEQKKEKEEEIERYCEKEKENIKSIEMCNELIKITKEFDNLIKLIETCGLLVKKIENYNKYAPICGDERGLKEIKTLRDSLLTNFYTSFSAEERDVIACFFLKELTLDNLVTYNMEDWICSYVRSRYGLDYDEMKKVLEQN